MVFNATFNNISVHMVAVSFIQGSHASWKTGNTLEFRYTHSRSGNVLENKKNGQNPGFTLEIFIESVIF